MADYEKPWLTIDQQVDHLADRGVDVHPRDQALALLASTGYYRLTGYLYPFRDAERYRDEDGRSRVRVLETYRPGSSIEYVQEIIDFDRKLRLLVLEGVERIEIAVRMQVGYVLGRTSPFAHLNSTTFQPNFVQPRLDSEMPIQHAVWLKRVAERRDSSDEAFVTHFRSRYDDQMPIWALTEILELGQLSRLYKGLYDESSLEIAQAFNVPTKRLMSSWLASLNYARNVAAHHARLFNRKLQNSPGRPKPDVIPVLNHLREFELKGGYGAYNILAVVAYLLTCIEGGETWTSSLVALLNSFPRSDILDLSSLGVTDDWSDLELWN
ncbi:Abi family protein [Brevibacterium aurantiacum]|uniref:Abi family protein n=1 Tax=Brevibacterium aurantiacum TaxID=273384 RepID=UPI0013FE165B